MEELDKAGRGGNIDVFAQTELAFVAASPRVKVAPVGHDHRVAVTAGNHRDALVPKRLQDLGLLGGAGATVAAHTLVTAAHAEDVSIARQVQSVVLAASDLKKAAYVLVLLRARKRLRLGSCAESLLVEVAHICAILVLLVEILGVEGLVLLLAEHLGLLVPLKFFLAGVAILLLLLFSVLHLVAVLLTVHVLVYHIYEEIQVG